MRPIPKPIRNILIFLGICFSLYAMMVIFVVSGAVFMFMPNPPAPEIKYGEFSCRLEYELDGEIKVIEDVIICEFDGFKNYGSAGSRREWKTSLESGNEYMTLLDLRPLNEIMETGNQLLELYFYYGNGKYYMENGNGNDAQDLDTVSVSYVTPDGIVGGSGYTAEEAWEKYKIKLISWECSPPIRNRFKK